MGLILAYLNNRGKTPFISLESSVSFSHRLNPVNLLKSIMKLIDLKIRIFKI